ncbi:hypothetical protein [Methylocaldum sp.]|uniref:hypothetical protein n=1 Tax=Methylocaldum sp. TaxID=1969727 RepID=UPI002D35F099|nr:hypothetical protein [Methylocaldum sp.]HYE36087.1 hypothetical protein [Methylocaldum sp.]
MMSQLIRSGCAALAFVFLRPASAEDAVPPPEPSVTEKVESVLDKRNQVLKDAVREMDDPTRLTPALRDALRNASPKAPAAPSGQAPAAKPPKVRLVAAVRGGGDDSKAMIEVDGTNYLIEPNAEITCYTQSGEQFTVRAKAFDDTGIHLELLPFRQTLILR